MTSLQLAMFTNLWFDYQIFILGFCTTYVENDLKSPVNSQLIITNQTVATRQRGNFGALGNFAHLTLSVILPGLDVVTSLDYIYHHPAYNT